MPTPFYCLHCRKETNQRCACCPSSYYCGTECQRLDWHSVHKYEDLGASSGDSPTNTVTPVREQRKKEISIERNEYNEIIHKTLKVLEKQGRTKAEMRLTHTQRKQMQLNLGGIVPNPLVRREEERRRFLRELEG